MKQTDKQISVDNIQISAQPVVMPVTAQPVVNNSDIDMAITLLESARNLLQ